MEKTIGNYQSLNKNFMNGQWVESQNDKTYDILNPYDDSVIATVRLATEAELNETFEIAHTAQKKWAKATASERKAVIEKARDYFTANRDEIVQFMAKETGGSVLKSNVEVDLTIGALEEAVKMPDEIGKVKSYPSPMPGKENHIYRQPLGVISSISPFNFPLYLSMRTIVPALALGNSVVHKPDIQVGITGGSIIAKAFEEAGLPAGVLNVILTDIPEIGDGMITNPHVKLISFTGSTAVGKHIGKTAGGLLKRVALELGGNSPFVVLSDADVDQAVNAAVFGKFLHQGQICMAINRFVIHEDQYDAFVQKFVERAKQVQYGDPSNPENIIGPLINQQQMDKALNLIEEAKQNGTEVLLEGKREGNILTPYVFGNVDSKSNLAQSELFAPIASMIKAASDEEAIELANDTEYGLSSAIFTEDLEAGELASLQIEAGMTHVNDQTVNDFPDVPFGGTKSSGLGRFGNPWIVEEFTEAKWVSVQKEKRDFPF